MTTALFFPPLATSEQFVLDQLAHAEAHIRRLTAHMDAMRNKLVSTGKTLLEADALLAESSKPWRQFRKDFAFFHGLWARLTRTLAGFRRAATPSSPSPAQPAPADEPPPQAAPSPRPLPIRVVKIGRNEKCPCGSGRKHKFCCLGKPASPQAA